MPLTRIFSLTSEVGPPCSPDIRLQEVFFGQCSIAGQSRLGILPGICQIDALEFHRVFRLVFLLLGQ